MRPALTRGDSACKQAGSGDVRVRRSAHRPDVVEGVQRHAQVYDGGELRGASVWHGTGVQDAAWPPLPPLATPQQAARSPALRHARAHPPHVCIYERHTIHPPRAVRLLPQRGLHGGGG